jgi:hypothetical protein
MFATWLIVTTLLCYSVAAYMWSPPPQQLEKEFIKAEHGYRQSQAVVARIGVLINKGHYMIIQHRVAVIAVLTPAWLITTTLWVYY